MTRPYVAITPWRLLAPTVLHPETELFSVEAHYLAALERAGADCAMLTWADTDADAARRLDRFDALVLTGGQDVDPASYGADVDGAVEMLPQADRSESAYVRAAINQGKPILAVCRGAQVLNVTFGGTLTQHMWGKSDEHPDPPRTGDVRADSEAFLANRHGVALQQGSQVAKAMKAMAIATNSLHHQSIDELGDDLVVSGIAVDFTIEVVEHIDHPAIGVQWHPEWLSDEGHDSLFEWLVGEAIQRAESR